MSDTCVLDLSVVIPAYNEERRLPETLRGWQAFLRQQSYSAELLVVDDGSRDATAGVAEATGVRVLRLDQNQGKGGALFVIMSIYPWTELGTKGSPFVMMFEKIGIGSAAGIINFVVLTAALSSCNSGIFSTGRMLFFRRSAAHHVFERCRIRSFAFDIEALFIARKLGASIVELPVSTTYRAESTFDVRRHLPRLLADIIQIRRNDLAGLYG